MAKQNIDGIASSEAADKANAKAIDATKVQWDDSRMNTSYANVCNVLGSREEITLLFGANQAWHSGQKEVKVLLSDRIVLNPYAAKRMAMILERTLKEYEARYGKLDLQS